MRDGEEFEGCVVGHFRATRFGRFVSSPSLSSPRHPFCFRFCFFFHIGRTPSGVEVLDGSSLETLRTYPGESSGLELAPDGSTFAMLTASGLVLRPTHPSGSQKEVVLPIEHLQAVAYSPSGRYVTTWRKHSSAVGQGLRAHHNTSKVVAPAPGESATAVASASSNGSKPSGGDLNLVVWRVSDGAPLIAFVQKQLDRDDWPSVRFGPDDALLFRLAPSGVAAFDVASLEQRADAEGTDEEEAAGAASSSSPSSSRALPSAPSPKFRLRVPNAAAFAPAPASEDGRLLVAVHAGPSKGSPGSVTLHDCRALADGSASDASVPPALARRGFYRATHAQLTWNRRGTAVLALASTDVDATNKSYYGERSLHFLSADPKVPDAAVELPKEGPVHDVQWSPRSDCFIALAGFMPAKAMVFDDTCKPRYDLGSGPHCLVRWNPQGRFFALAGFGNLPGDVAVYDRKADGKCRPLGAAKAWNGVTLEWSPDGRRMLVSTVAPRLRVDNCVRTYKYSGEELAKKEFPVLFQALWRPDPEGTHPNKPATPRAAAAQGAAAGPGAFSAAPASGAAGAAKAAPLGAAPAPAANPRAGAAAAPKAAVGYIPPHLRGRADAAQAVAASRSVFSLARDESDKGGKVKAAGAAQPRAPPVRLPPGATIEDVKGPKKRNRRRGKGPKDGDADAAAEGVQGLKV